MRRPCFLSICSSEMMVLRLKKRNQIAIKVDIFRDVGETILQNALAGFNGCLFAYGQTGSDTAAVRETIPNLGS